VLAPKNSVLANILLEANPWKPIYKDVAVMFTRILFPTE